MYSEHIPAKTAAGDAELLRRELDLPWRARALLQTIRGDRTIGQLRQQFGERDMEELLNGLHELGLIDFVTAATPAPTLHPMSAAGAASRPAAGLRAFLFRRAMPD